MEKYPVDITEDSDTMETFRGSLLRSFDGVLMLLLSVVLGATACFICNLPVTALPSPLIVKTGSVLYALIFPLLLYFGGNYFQLTTNDLVVKKAIFRWCKREYSLYDIKEVVIKYRVKGGFFIFIFDKNGKKKVYQSIALKKEGALKLSAALKSRGITTTEMDIW